MSTLQPGDNITMKRFVASGDGWDLTYGNLKGGRKYVFVFLGAGSPEQPLDGNLAMNGLGWVFDPKKARKLVTAHLAENSAREPSL